MDGKREIAEFKAKYGIDRIVCCYSDRGVEQLVNILTYRAEHAQYELWRECCGDLTWEEYLCFLCDSKQMRERARRVLLAAQRNFGADQFDFDAPQMGGDGESVQIVRLFEGELMEAAVIFFLFKAELAHYQQVRLARGEAYTLEQYMRDLWTDEPLKAALCAGFEDGISRLDFQKAWIQEGYDFPEDLLDD